MDYTSALQKFTYLRSAFWCATSSSADVLLCSNSWWWRQKMTYDVMKTRVHYFAPPLFWSKMSQTGSKSRPLYLLRFGPLVLIWMASKTQQENSFDSLSSTLTPVQSWPPLCTTCFLTADFELAALHLCSERTMNSSFHDVISIWVNESDHNRGNPRLVFWVWVNSTKFHKIARLNCTKIVASRLKICQLINEKKHLFYTFPQNLLSNNGKVG